MKKITLTLLAFGLSAQFAQANTITLFVNPAQKEINFKGPRSMLFSFGTSYAKQFIGGKLFNFHKGGMGHVVARVDCRDTKGVEHSFYAGLSGQYSTEQDKIDLFEDRLGLGVLFREYPDGYIQTSSYVKLLVGDHRGRLMVDGRGHIKRMKPKFMSFEVSPSQCEKAVDYYSTFKSKSFGEPPTREQYVTMAPQEPLYFSFNYDPASIYEKIKKSDLSVEDTKMGGGCSSFATGFLKVAGVFDSQFDNTWKVNLKVGQSLIGDPSRDHAVKFTEVVKSSRWSKGNEKTKSLSFYHPENIWAFLEGVEDCLAGRTKSRFCTNEVLAWTKKNSKRLNRSQQRIKFEKELRAPEGQTPRTVKRVRELQGFTLKAR